MQYKQEDFLDARGAMKTELLFAETIQAERKSRYSPLYTLKERDGELPSAYRVYMSSVDEYEAAMKLLGSMRHWRRLCGLNWFMKGIPEKGFDGLASWRKDMELRDKSKAKKQLKEAAEAGVVSAQQTLYRGASQPKPKAEKRGDVGRPQKPDNSQQIRENKIAEIFGSK